MFGPGSTWQIASVSTNCALLSQCLRSTRSRCAIASTPPKPCSEMLLNVKNSSASDSGRCGGDASGGTRSPPSRGGPSAAAVIA